MRHLALTLAAAAAFAAGAPAVAQTVEQLTVTGHALRNQPQSLTETVSYADLNLTSPRDRSVLSMRVNDAAGRICDRLNEAPPSAGNLGHSCQEVAVRDAMDQVRQAYADARASARAARAARAPARAYARSAPAPAYAESYAAPVSATVTTYSNGPVPDTAANRARYGGPMSHAGRLTAPRGN